MNGKRSGRLSLIVFFLLLQASSLCTVEASPDFWDEEFNRRLFELQGTSDSFASLRRGEVFPSDQDPLFKLGERFKQHAAQVNGGGGLDPSFFGDSLSMGGSSLSLADAAFSLQFMKQRALPTLMDLSRKDIQVIDQYFRVNELGFSLGLVGELSYFDALQRYFGRSHWEMFVSESSLRLSTRINLALNSYLLAVSKLPNDPEAKESYPEAFLFEVTQFIARFSNLVGEQQKEGLIQMILQRPSFKKDRSADNLIYEILLSLRFLKSKTEQQLESGSRDVDLLKSLVAQQQIVIRQMEELLGSSALEKRETKIYTSAHTADNLSEQQIAAATSMSTEVRTALGILPYQLKLPLKQAWHLVQEHFPEENKLSVVKDAHKHARSYVAIATQDFDLLGAAIREFLHSKGLHELIQKQVTSAQNGVGYSRSLIINPSLPETSALNSRFGIESLRIIMSVDDVNQNLLINTIFPLSGPGVVQSLTCAQRLGSIKSTSPSTVISKRED